MAFWSAPAHRSLLCTSLVAPVDSWWELPSLIRVADRASDLPPSLGCRERWRAWGLSCTHSAYLPLSLFPTMPRHNLHKVAPLVKSLCTKHGIKYQEKSLLRALLDIVR